MSGSEEDPVRADALSRRGLLGGIAVTGLVSLVGAPARATGALTSLQQDMLLKVTRAVAQFPVEFPDLGGRTSALSRASANRLSTMVSRLKPQRLSKVGAAADELINAGMLRRQPRDLVNALGGRAADQGMAEGTPIVVLVSLASATLNGNADPNSDALAHLWVDTMARLHSHGTLSEAAARRGLR